MGINDLGGGATALFGIDGGASLCFLVGLEVSGDFGSPRRLVPFLGLFFPLFRGEGSGGGEESLSEDGEGVLAI